MKINFLVERYAQYRKENFVGVLLPTFNEFRKFVADLRNNNIEYQFEEHNPFKDYKFGKLNPKYTMTLYETNYIDDEMYTQKPLARLHISVENHFDKELAGFDSMMEWLDAQCYHNRWDGKLLYFKVGDYIFDSRDPKPEDLKQITNK